jgi:hypothetical protein
VDSQTDPANKARLAEAFDELTRSTPLTADRINRIRKEHLSNVKTYMQIAKNRMCFCAFQFASATPATCKTKRLGWQSAI